MVLVMMGVPRFFISLAIPFRSSKSLTLSAVLTASTSNDASGIDVSGHGKGHDDRNISCVSSISPHDLPLGSNSIWVAHPRNGKCSYD